MTTIDSPRREGRDGIPSADDEHEEASSEQDWDSLEGALRTNNSNRQRTAVHDATIHAASQWLTSLPPLQSPDTTTTTSSKSPAFDQLLSPISGVTPNNKTTPHTQASTPPTSSIIPSPYIKLITAAFGYDCDLYNDVLQIPPDADHSDIRVAYFRRGRQVLSDDNKNYSASDIKTSSSFTGAVSSTAKMRFQAVSMAYDILTNPEWRAAYDDYGLHGGGGSLNNTNSDDDDEEDYVDEIASTRSVASLSALRNSSSSGRKHQQQRSSTTRKSGGVRWKEEVEELVFAQDPGEIKGGLYDEDEGEYTSEDSTDSKKKKKKKKKKRSKKRVVVETERLQETLEQLDKEAEESFVHDFLDEIEQSIEGMLSFGSMGTSKAGAEKKEYFKDARKKLFHETQPKAFFGADELLFPDENREPVTDSELEIRKEKTKKKKKHRAKTIVTIESFEPLGQQQQQQRVPPPVRTAPASRSTNPFDEVDDEIKLSSSAPSPTNPLNNVPLDSAKKSTTNPFDDDETQEDEPEDDDNGFDDEYEEFVHPDAPVKAKKKKKKAYVAPSELFVTKNVRREVDDDGISAAITVDDTVSTISESVVSVATKNSFKVSVAHASDLAPVDELNDSGEAVVADAGSMSTDKVTNKADRCGIADELGFEAWPCGGGKPQESPPTIHRTISSTNPFETEPSSSHADESEAEAPQFHVYLMTYLKALSHDLYDWGRSIGDMDWMESLSVSEGDLESMMGILKTELALTPGDLPEDHLPLELKQTFSF